MSLRLKSEFSRLVVEACSWPLSRFLFPHHTPVLPGLPVSSWSFCTRFLDDLLSFQKQPPRLCLLRGLASVHAPRKAANFSESNPAHHGCFCLLGLFLSHPPTLPLCRARMAVILYFCAITYKDKWPVHLLGCNLKAICLVVIRGNGLPLPTCMTSSRSEGSADGAPLPCWPVGSTCFSLTHCFHWKAQKWGNGMLRGPCAHRGSWGKADVFLSSQAAALVGLTF